MIEINSKKKQKTQSNNEKQKQKTKQKHEEWLGTIEDLAAKMGNDEKTQKALEPLKSLVEMLYCENPCKWGI